MMLLQNVLLALVWVALTGELTASNFAVGFLLGYMLLGLLGRVFGSRGYFTRVLSVIGFVAFFIWSLIVASARVAFTVLAPNLPVSPAVVAVPLDLQTDAEIVLLANWITLTPGTLTLDVSADRSTLYVHAMHVKDLEAFRQDIKQSFERKVIEVMR